MVRYPLYSSVSRRGFLDFFFFFCSGEGKESAAEVLLLLLGCCVILKDGRSGEPQVFFFSHFPFHVFILIFFVLFSIFLLSIVFVFSLSCVSFFF